MKSIYAWFFLIFPLMWGCFEDKGNYNYKELNEITCEDIDNFYLSEGDGIKVIPKLHFKLDSINLNLKHEWKIGDQTFIGDSLVLDVYPGQLGYTRCQYIVTDLNNGMSYFFIFSVRLTAKYQKGWLILSEDAGKSHLSFVYETPKKDKDGQVLEVNYKEDLDVYKKISGEDLGEQPVKLVEHFIGKTMSDVLAEVIVLQNGEKGPVALNGGSLQRETYLSEEFIGGKLPVGFKAKDAMFFSWTHYLLSEDGKMYSRKADINEGFHAGMYDPEPMGGNEYSVSSLLPSCFYEQDGGMFYDKKGERYLYIYDSRWNKDPSGEVVNISYNKYPDDFTPLHDLGESNLTLVYSGFKGNTYYSDLSYFSILRNTKTGQYHRQYFTIDYWPKTFDIMDFYEKPFVGGELFNENAPMSVGRMTNFFFFTGGVEQNELYWMGIQSDVRPALYKKFEGDRITSISAASEEDLGERIGVGMASGKFYIFDVSNKVLASGNPKLLYELQGKPGEIKDVIFKIGSGGEFWTDGSEGR